MKHYQPLTDADIRQLASEYEGKGLTYCESLEAIVLDALRQFCERRYGPAELYLRAAAELIDRARYGQPPNYSR